jgi:hypothetical protein
MPLSRTKRARTPAGAHQPNRTATRLAAFFQPTTLVAIGAAARPKPAAPPPPSPLVEKYQLARQLLATLSPLVLAESGHLERRGRDRSTAAPDSLRAARLRRGAARARARAGAPA